MARKRKRQRKKRRLSSRDYNEVQVLLDRGVRPKAIASPEVTGWSYATVIRIKKTKNYAAYKASNEKWATKKREEGKATEEKTALPGDVEIVKLLKLLKKIDSKAGSIYGALVRIAMILKEKEAGKKKPGRFKVRG